MTGRVRPTLTSVIALAALAIAVGGAAYGAIPGADGRIRGCYEADPAGSGAVLKDLYVVDASDSCPGGTQELVWSQAGPGGPTGATGPIGPTGPSGPTGATSQPHGAYRTDVRYLKKTFTPPYDLQAADLVVDCQHDETAIGGGAKLRRSAYNPNLYNIAGSFPTLNERSWLIRIERLNVLVKFNPRFRPGVTVEAWAVCARTLVVANPPLPPSTGVTFGPRP
jgi:hypothetical protein